MKKLSVTLALIGGTAITANAKTIKDGALNYSGGQTDTKVYSSISDAKTGYVDTSDDGQYYNVKAIVKVGGNKYTSGWRQGKAYKSKKRVWYANETSYYSTALRDRCYSNWAGKIE